MLNVSVTDGPQALWLMRSVAVMRPPLIVPVIVPVNAEGASDCSEPDEVAVNVPFALNVPRYVRVTAVDG